MAHFYPGTLLEISCYHIYPLSSSLACILIKFVQSAVFTIGDPGFFISFSIYPFLSLSSFSFAVFIDLFPCLSLGLLVLEFLFFIISFPPHPFHPNFHSILL